MGSLNKLNVYLRYPTPVGGSIGCKIPAENKKAKGYLLTLYININYECGDSRGTTGGRGGVEVRSRVAVSNRGSMSMSMLMLCLSINELRNGGVRTHSLQWSSSRRLPPITPRGLSKGFCKVGRNSPLALRRCDLVSC
jgi:hypothetical protein